MHRDDKLWCAAAISRSVEALWLRLTKPFSFHPRRQPLLKPRSLCFALVVYSQLDIDLSSGGDGMPKPRPSTLGVVLRFLRFANGWSQTELAQAAGIGVGLLNRYEMGRHELTREKLEELLAVIGVPPEAIDAALYALAIAFPPPEGPGSPVDPTLEQLRSIQQAAAEAGQGAVEAAHQKLTRNVRRLLAARARRRADALWQELQKLSAARRRSTIETERKYWTWAFAERLCAESVRAAAHRADAAMGLAGLALRVAELAPGSDPWRSRLQGYAWAFVANARRVSGDLPGAEEAFLRSDRLWEAGAPSDPGVLDASRLLDLRASLRSYQGQFDAALVLLDKALKVTQSEQARARLLVNKAIALRFTGDFLEALEVIRQAESVSERVQDSRHAWLIRFNVVANLLELARFGEAEVLISEVRELAIGLSNELDLVRTLWLQARVEVGLGRQNQATASLEQVKRYFTSHQIAFDTALASLELAVLYLEEGHTAEVKRLAEEMLWIFRVQGVHQEALAALRLFCEAARKEEVTVKMAQQVLDYLVRSRHNPQLPFEP
jgi:transcriptional regulator with XRE-family HTH domain